MVKRIFQGVIALCVVFLVLINAQNVPFNYIYGSAEVKLDLIILLAFAAGVGTVLIGNFIGKAQGAIDKILSYSKNKKQKSLQNDFDEALKCIGSGNDSKAKELLTAYLKEMADSTDAYLQLADIHMRAGEVSEAEELLVNASITTRHDAAVLNRLAEIYTISKKYSKAIKIYEELREKEEDKDLYLKKVYDVLTRKKDYKKAYKVIKQLSIGRPPAKELKDELLKTKFNLSLALIQEGATEEAEQKLKSIMDEDNRFYGAYISYATLLMKRGAKKEAVKQLTGFYEDTKFPYFAKMLEKIFIDSEEPDKAIKFYQRQIDSIALGQNEAATRSEAWKDSQALILYALYIRLLMDLEMIDFALETIEDVVGTEDDKKLFHLFLAECHLRHKNYESAAKQYQEFLKWRRLHPMMLRCRRCGTEHDEFRIVCTSCGVYNKINYFVS